uniref:Zinc transporter ZIP11 n=1 Tax=Anoplophora glabripennis TaxID=217634 RepID=V5I8I4_ANOGL
MMLALHATSNRKDSRRSSARRDSHVSSPDSTAIDGFSDTGHSVQRRRSYDETCNIEEIQHGQWKRIILLVVAITVHNIPEGLAVGVGFGAIGTSASATFESARNLAIGIGIQNFPEGLAVSLPLQAAGFSTWRSLWYGQLSGMVEPIFGVLGAVAVGLAEPALPYALAFAAGAMIYVVVDDIIPEANTNDNGKLATWGAILGFLVMMTLDVGLG